MVDRHGPAPDDAAEWDTITEFDLAAQFAALWRRKVGVGLIVIATTLAATARSVWLKPDIYEATTTILPRADSGGGVLDAVGQLAGGAVLGALGVGASSSNTKQLVNVLTSRTMLERVAVDLSLLRTLQRAPVSAEDGRGGMLSVRRPDELAAHLVMMHPSVAALSAQDRVGVLHVDDDSMRAFVEAAGASAPATTEELDDVRRAWYARVQHVLDQLSDNVAVNASRDGGLITVSVRVARDRDAPARIANRYTERLAEYSRDHSLSEARLARVFIAARLAIVRDDLATAEARIEAFKRETGLLALREQLAQLVAAAAQAEGELTARRIARDALVASGVAPGNPKVVALAHQIVGLEHALRQLLAGERSPLDGGGVDSIPLAERVLTGLMREQQVQDTLFKLLAQQHELAKIDEARDRPRFEVLDAATPAVDPVSPRRTVDVGVGFAAGCGIAVLYAMLIGRLPGIWQGRLARSQPGDETPS